MTSCFFASRSCFKHFSRQQALPISHLKKGLKSRKVFETATRSKKNMKSLWKVKGFEKPATWKESVPDCTPPTHCTPKHQPHTHRTLSKSMSVRTRKMTFSWWLVAILTCNSFVTFRSARFPQDWSSTASSGKAND